MKKIFIVTGEASGDNLASKVISKLKETNSNIKFSCVGGSNLEALGIKSIFNLKEITYIGFTSVILNFFKIKKRINQTIEEVIKFDPDILFTVDSPEFTLRVAKKVKSIKPSIKTIHYVAPQVWIWREKRIKQFKKFLDHILLLFEFETEYFNREKIKNTFVGHPLIEKKINKKIELSNIIKTDKKIISIFPGSRESELNILLPILSEFIKLMNKKSEAYFFIFHSTKENREKIHSFVKKQEYKNCDVISNEDIKNKILSQSVFAVAKSGTISLEICSLNIPSIIIYKINYINFFIMKLLVKVKFANIINIINKKEIIPELLQNECNSYEIFKTVNYFLKNPNLMNEQIQITKKTLDGIKSKTFSSNEACLILKNYLS